MAPTYREVFMSYKFGVYPKLKFRHDGACRKVDDDNLSEIRNISTETEQKVSHASQAENFEFLVSS